ncbi:MAG: hypothetical protein IJ545_08085 [Alphaproteobacteria bacterium]|nr:hypothetical protein [Alphaproteobacteria bacterium]
MREIYTLCCLMGIMLCGHEVQAYSFGNSLELNDKQISNEIGTYQKLAGVRFILNDGTDKTQDCPSGQEKVGGECIDADTCASTFTLTTINKNAGTYVTKDCGSKGTRYCYTSCRTGWVRNGCSCDAVDCNGFPHSVSSGQHCNGVKSCKTGDSYKYKCTACETGYELDTSTGVCKEKSCGRDYKTSITPNCTEVDTDKAGDNLCYKCKKCKEGWTLTSEFTCSENSCGTTTTMIEHCVVYESVTKTGANICYKCKTCAPGYELNSTGTACSAKKADTGYSTGTTCFSNCTSISTQMAGTEFYHKCLACNNGYEVGTSGACSAIVCPSGSVNIYLCPAFRCLIKTN